MNGRTQITLAALLYFTGVGSGYLLLPTSTKTIIKEVQTETKKEENVTAHTETRKTKNPDGSETTVIIKDETATTNTDSSRSASSQATSAVQAPPKTINISALGAIDARTLLPAYGASVQAEVLGPITIGAFGLTNQTFGVSIGVNF